VAAGLRSSATLDPIDFVDRALRFAPLYAGAAMDPVKASITIDRPPAAVFDYLADVANHSEFLDHFLQDWQMLRVDTAGAGAGGRFKIKARFQRFGWADYTLVEVARPQRIVAMGRGGKFNRIKFTWQWDLSPVSGGTELAMVAETEPPLPTDRLVEAFGLRSAFKRGLRRGLSRLQAILEEDHAGSRGQRATIAGVGPYGTR
jgi:uncharacterized protein YndB with AHSA1/START domain